MRTFIYLITFNVRKHIRSYKFLLIISVSVFLGILCVPDGHAGYEVVYLGGVRGIYNSAWLGGMGSLLPAILLWLPGFYLLRSEISEEKHLFIGSMIASSPISKPKYILGKSFANFIVLAALALIFLTALIGMQLVRHEDMQISLLQFVQPFLFLTVPYLLVLAALTVLFDVFPGLKGVVGNVVIFGVWITLLSTSVLVQDNRFDLLGLGTTLTKMAQGAQIYFPEIHSKAGSLGFNITNGSSPVFAWSGMAWSADFLASRFVWMAVALFIMMLSSLFFDRFGEADNVPQRERNNKFKIKLSCSGIEVKQTLSPVTKETLSFFRLAKGEWKIMLSGCSVWWYLTALICMVLSLVVPFQRDCKWISLILLLPIAIWSQMGCRETYDVTSELVKSSCPLPYKRAAEWLAGVWIAAVLSSGVLIHFALLAEWEQVAAWSIGILIIPTLALLLGCLGGSRTLFQAVYIAWFYFGPINGVPFLDFLGLSHHNIVFYAVLTCVFLLLTYFHIWNDEKRLGSLFGIIFLMAALAGCGKKSDMERVVAYPFAEVEMLVVKTNANDVILRSAEGDDLTITFQEGDGEWASMENGRLTVDLHKNFAGITMKNLAPLYVDIPKDWLSVVNIQSDAGNITVDRVNITDLSVNTEVGDITSAGLSGHIDAVSSVGSIETDLPIASEIAAGKDGLGNVIHGNVNGENTTIFNTEFYTNTGKIILK